MALEVIQFYPCVLLSHVVGSAPAHNAEPLLGVRIPSEFFVFHEGGPVHAIETFQKSNPTNVYRRYSIVVKDLRYC